MDETVKKSKKNKTLTIILICVAAVILAAAVVVFCLGKGLLGRIGRVGDDVPTLSQEEIDQFRSQTDAIDSDSTLPQLDASDVDMSENEAEIIVAKKNVVNILVVGQDRRDTTSRQRTDCMILCTIDKNEKTLTMTSFLRDLWVHIPGYDDDRMNAAYVYGGFPLLDKTMKYNFGVTPDHNIEIDFEGFKKIIDILGGVEITLTAKEAKHIRQVYALEVEEGLNLLSGKEALVYARTRKIDNDFSRTDRQRTVITAVIEKIRTLSVAELYELCEEILPLITTDMTDAEILGYLVSYAPMLNDLQIVSQHIPMDGTYSFSMIENKSVITMTTSQLNKNRKLLKDTISG